MVFSYLGWRFKGLCPALEGVPVVVVRDGQPLDEVLKLERLTMDEVLEAARDQGIGDLGDVRLGVLEPDGKVSFITRGGQQHPAAEKHEA